MIDSNKEKLLKLPENELIDKIIKDSYILKYLPHSIKGSKKFVLKLLNTAKSDHLNIMGLISSNLRDDDEVVSIFLKNNGYCLIHASDRIKDDEKMVLLALEDDGVAINGASDRIKNKKEIGLIAVTKDVYALNALSEELKDDYDVVKSAVNFGGYALKYVSERFKNNKEIVMDAVKQYGEALCYASEDLKNDKEVVLAAYKNDTKASKHLGKELIEELAGRDIEKYLESVLMKDSLHIELNNENIPKKKLKL